MATRLLKIDLPGNKELYGISSAQETKLDGIEALAQVNLVEDVTVNGTTVVNPSTKVAAIDISGKANKVSPTGSGNGTKVTVNSEGVVTNIGTAGISDITGLQTALDSLEPTVTDVQVNDSTIPNYTTVLQGTVAKIDISGKVDKVSGKQLSTEDYTTAEKTKLAGIEPGAQVNVQSDWLEASSSDDAFIQNKPTFTGGTNVIVDLTDNEYTISVPGIALPDKFTSEEEPTEAFGESGVFDSTVLTQITGSGSLSVDDIVIFANGLQGQVTAVDSGNDEFTAVIIFVPTSTSWGNIGGDIENQLDLMGAFNTKENVITAGNTSQYWRGDKNWQTLDKTAVGLGNVDNTSDINKPISTATQTALDTKVDKVTTASQFYGTTSTGTQTTYDITDFENAVEDVKVNGTSVVDAYKVANITVPTVNDGTLTIQKNGTTVQTFTANQAGNATANIAVPVNTSDLVNDGDGTTTSTTTAASGKYVIGGVATDNNFTTTHKTKVDNLGTVVTGASSSLNYTATQGTVTLNNINTATGSTGTVSITLDSATDTVAGLMSASDKNKLDILLDTMAVVRRKSSTVSGANGVLTQFSISALSIVTTILSASNYVSIFLNGIKLISGVDFNLSVSGTIFDQLQFTNIVPQTGDIIEIEYEYVQ